MKAVAGVATVERVATLTDIWADSPMETYMNPLI